jgi:hypothetical protein
MLVLTLASCERKGEQRAQDPPPSGTAPSKPPEERPSKDGEEGPILVEKKPPVAEPMPGQPGVVISPFNGKPIDVKGIAPGTLVADPTYPLEAKKYFRVPEIPEADSDAEKLLDPSILIRPKPPKEDEVKEEP